ncbi:adenylosuccinate lyase [Leifsonia shinshuensis]|uniref:lyase family protein n=1 Tax=Leifsonia shinshuensis TaxID=150026 RepID=UPI001F50C48D|nr:lyase family protein [Leifsonia shinshuensis]MCI0157883.1 adenylosuccinate lyase [Leifsonia shinshuensis]
MADAFDWGLLEPAGALGASVGDDRVLAAMVAVEAALAGAWREIEGTGSASDAPAFDVDAIDRGRLVDGARDAGVPIIALVAQLREQAGEAADAVHRGATSQDIVDTALVLVSRDGLARAAEALATAADALAELAVRYRATPVVARTLSQPAEPTTVGAQFATWLDGVSSAREALDALSAAGFPVQLGGAVGTGAAFVRASGRDDAPAILRAAVARRLGLSDPGRAWHTDRTPAVAIADAAARVCVATGRIGRDLALAARDGAFRPAGGGGSSAMPHKRNPVDAVILSANGLRAPGLLATVHAATLSSDARPAGEWHAEWQAWRGLLRLALESAEVLANAIADLVVEASPNADGVAADDVDLAAAGAVVDAAIARHGRTDRSR